MGLNLDDDDGNKRAQRTVDCSNFSSVCRVRGREGKRGTLLFLGLNAADCLHCGERQRAHSLFTVASFIPNDNKKGGTHTHTHTHAVVQKTRMMMVLPIVSLL
jgi:hypothetical protein